MVNEILFRFRQVICGRGRHRSGTAGKNKLLQGQGKEKELHSETGKIYIVERSLGKVKF